MTSSPDSPSSKNRKPSSKHPLIGWLKFLLRWGIAIVGIWWIVSQITFRDRVNVVMPDGTVKSLALTKPATEESNEFAVEGLDAPVPKSNVVSQPDRKTVPVHQTLSDANSPVVQTPLLGLHLDVKKKDQPQVDQLVVKDPAGTGGVRIAPQDVVGGFTLRTPRPVVEKGLITMGREANPWLLALAILVFPLTIVITTFRWDSILKSQEIALPYRTVFVLNMVGAFYNSFFPGSTGGDFLKAYYASRQTTHKIRAMISVFVDRVIGLLALVMLGGIMAAYGFLSVTDLGAFAHDLGKLRDFSLSGFIHGNTPALLTSVNPTARACLGVAMACAAIVFGAAVALLVLSSSRLRRLLGFQWLMSKLPMQHHLDKVREAMKLYRAKLYLLPWWIVVTFPIHSTVVVSAIIAGQAFGLHIAWPYYFVCVPVMVLVASIPISPQGAGVMEYFGFLLLAKQGATVSEVLAITLSIRFVQLFWNLVGGLFVMGGGFNATDTSYDEIADEDEEPEPITAR